MQYNLKKRNNVLINIVQFLRHKSEIFLVVTIMQVQSQKKAIYTRGASET